MPVEILMPELGEGVHEGTVSRWLKKVGDTVKEDEPIVEIMTDKVNTELPAPASGTLAQILIKEGDPVGVFQAMGLIAEAGESAVTTPMDAPAPQAEETTLKGEEMVIAVPTGPASVAPIPTVDGPGAQPAGGNGKKWFSPVVRSMAKQHGVSDAELGGISGSGTGGRVTKKDFEAYLGGGRKAVPAGSGSAAPMPNMDVKPAAPTHAGADQELVPLVGMRKMIADAMVRSSQVPTVSTTIEVDVTNMVKFREINKDSFLETYGVKLTYTPFFIKALTEALLEFPMLNAALMPDNQIVMNKVVHMGVAVSLGKNGDEGLIVPVIRNCESKSIVDIAKDLENIAKRARSNALGVADVQGGTFTLTNPGSYGALFGTPMINSPQAGIAGTYGINQVTKVVDGMIAIRSVMYMVLTYDHRIIDGLLAGKFLQSVKKKIEEFSFLK
jgi:pyruvate/2-oxoglutarate dehydrogenase complex dihydrolipoamide acyltransferase (E2) component